MSRILMKGNEAIGEGAVRAGCRYFFGYPITPQSELTHYLAKRLPEVGGLYLQAESEVASINMVYGAAGAGARVMTSSSGPGISLMQEGLSYLAGAELPCVVVNMMRGGPGLGNIAPSQADYFQATKGGGHGDYHLIVLAPNSVQELLDFTGKAFELADYYRNPVMVMADGIMAQMMEPVELKDEAQVEIPAKPWAATGMIDHPGSKRIINSCYVIPEEMEAVNIRLKEKYTQITLNEQASEGYLLEDAEIVLVAFGTVSRICRAVVEKARQLGIPAGLFRPITLWPFPAEELKRTTGKAKCFLSVEMNMGQMVEDVQLTINGRAPVYHYGRLGGMVPVARDVLQEVQKLYSGGVVK
ncbi:MAG TPA: 3-methyl-2-oxobutanoate dehydrogenase subunit VorB [Bacillota bacterium]|nr:3-methyl-2-oxobutanoate dehydrogenase subunit VorB [Peptococcaceae bacterium MAG4]NLW38887.1 3-methyl-2-oxobutanoate dehydrogenase subunit VorB [Peptococcaceae bacterium]HPU36077.1 3-methyl-2-oxobutanoate dehydrogenase subunit VorB [Bacillota bacterium]HPZ42500.1 3-methyl-2-oxobutanoate dehydrogenase subunit VorB [Bacillota bacterium]HQD75292.1 3-methyl-2-oxobutanoate dehydrogenase subunit VorB [Bacillota bacterium]